MDGVNQKTRHKVDKREKINVIQGPVPEQDPELLDVLSAVATAVKSGENVGDSFVVSTEVQKRGGQQRMIKVVTPTMGNKGVSALQEVQDFLKGSPISKPPKPNAATPKRREDDEINTEFMAVMKQNMPIPDNIGDKIDIVKEDTKLKIVFLTTMSNVTLRRIGTRNSKPVYWIGEPDTAPDILNPKVMCVTDDVTKVHFYSAIARTSVKRFSLGKYTVFFLSRSHNGYTYIVLLQALFEIKYFGHVCNKEHLHCGNARIRVLQPEGELGGNDDNVRDPQVILFDPEILPSLKLPKALTDMICVPAVPDKDQTVDISQSSSKLGINIENKSKQSGISAQQEKEIVKNNVINPEIMTNSPEKLPKPAKVVRDPVTGKFFNLEKYEKLKMKRQGLHVTQPKMSKSIAVKVRKDPFLGDTQAGLGEQPQISEMICNTNTEIKKKDASLNLEKSMRSGRKRKLNPDFVNYLKVKKEFNQNIDIVHSNVVDSDPEILEEEESLDFHTNGSDAASSINLTQKQNLNDPDSVSGATEITNNIDSVKDMVQGTNENEAQITKLTCVTVGNEQISDIGKKTSDESNAIDIPVVRKRGRPRKYPRIQSLKQDSQSQPNSQKVPKLDLSRKIIIVKQGSKTSIIVPPSEVQNESDQNPKVINDVGDHAYIKSPEKEGCSSSTHDQEHEEMKLTDNEEDNIAYEDDPSDVDYGKYVKKNNNRGKKGRPPKPKKLGDAQELEYIKRPRLNLLNEDSVNECEEMSHQSHESGFWKDADIVTPMIAFEKAKKNLCCKECIMDHDPHPSDEGGFRCNIVNPSVVVPNPEISCLNCTSHSIATLPSDLTLRVSPHTNKLGVYAFKKLQKFMQFGPLVGILMTDKEITLDTDLSHVWFLRYDEEGTCFFLNTAEENASNWCRYLQCGYGMITNTVLVQKEEGLFFVTTCDISEGEILRVDIPYFGNKQRPLIRNYELSKCLTCKKQFEGPLEFQKHLHISHPHGFKKQKQECSVCKMNLCSMKELRDHCMQLHEGKGAPYICDICGRGFFFLAHFHTHLKDNHPTPDQAIQCPKCNKMYRNHRALKDHDRNVHCELSYVCTVCNKSFSCKPVLMKHMKKHNSDFSQFCSHCSKGFYDKWSLMMHVATHTGEKPYRCEVEDCTEGFNSKKNMEEHYIFTHGYHGNNLPDISPADLPIRSEVGMKFASKRKVRPAESEKKRYFSKPKDGQNKTLVVVSSQTMEENVYQLVDNDDVNVENQMALMSESEAAVTGLEISADNSHLYPIQDPTTDYAQSDPILDSGMGAQYVTVEVDGQVQHIEVPEAVVMYEEV